MFVFVVVETTVDVDVVLLVVVADVISVFSAVVSINRKRDYKHHTAFRSCLRDSSGMFII